MSLALRPARPLDAGAVGEILHRFETETPWMPKQHSGAEAVAFCATMIDRGWVSVAVITPVASPGQGWGSGRGAPGAAAPGAPRPLPALSSATGSRDGEQVIAGFLAREGEAVHALYIRPDCTGQGIGAALLGLAKSESPRLRLWTFQANTGAQRFYLREGFGELCRTDGDGNDEGLPDIQYLWPAEAA
ncbi:putative acetyltransferase [Marinibacterium anthonyi]|nr:putative acetyltransferase [Marinibacterium anthonyi]